MIDDMGWLEKFDPLQINIFALSSLRKLKSLTPETAYIIFNLPFHPPSWQKKKYRPPCTNPKLMKLFKVTYFSCKVLLGINGVTKVKDISTTKSWGTKLQPVHVIIASSTGVTWFILPSSWLHGLWTHLILFHQINQVDGTPWRRNRDWI